MQTIRIFWHDSMNVSRRILTKITECGNSLWIEIKLLFFVGNFFSVFVAVVLDGSNRLCFMQVGGKYLYFIYSYLDKWMWMTTCGVIASWECWWGKTRPIYIYISHPLIRTDNTDQQLREEEKNLFLIRILPKLIVSFNWNGTK